MELKISDRDVLAFQLEKTMNESGQVAKPEPVSFDSDVEQMRAKVGFLADIFQKINPAVENKSSLAKRVNIHGSDIDRTFQELQALNLDASRGTTFDMLLTAKYYLVQERESLTIIKAALDAMEARLNSQKIEYASMKVSSQIPDALFSDEAYALKLWFYKRKVEREDAYHTSKTRNKWLTYQAGDLAYVARCKSIGEEKGLTDVVNLATFLTDFMMMCQASKASWEPFEKCLEWFKILKSKGQERWNDTDCNILSTVAPSLMTNIAGILWMRLSDNWSKSELTKEYEVFSRFKNAYNITVAGPYFTRQQAIFKRVQAELELAAKTSCASIKDPKIRFSVLGQIRNPATVDAYMSIGTAKVIAFDSAPKLDDDMSADVPRPCKSRPKGRRKDTPKAKRKEATSKSKLSELSEESADEAAAEPTDFKMSGPSAPSAESAVVAAAKPVVFKISDHAPKSDACSPYLYTHAIRTWMNCAPNQPEEVIQNFNTYSRYAPDEIEKFRIRHAATTLLDKYSMHPMYVETSEKFPGRKSLAVQFTYADGYRERGVFTFLTQTVGKNVLCYHRFLEKRELKAMTESNLASLYSGRTLADFLPKEIAPATASIMVYEDGDEVTVREGFNIVTIRDKRNQVKIEIFPLNSGDE